MLSKLRDAVTFPYKHVRAVYRATRPVKQNITTRSIPEEYFMKPSPLAKGVETEPKLTFFQKVALYIYKLLNK